MSRNFTKQKHPIVLLTLFSLCGCANNPGINNEDSASRLPSSNSAASESTGESVSSLNDKKVQWMDDNHFTTGFYLKEWTTVNGGPVVRHLNYGASVETVDPEQGGHRNWIMARWWDPYDFANATETQIGENEWRYEDQSSYCDINPSSGSLTMYLNSYDEYLTKFGGSRSSSSQNWSHFLIEQTTTNRVCLQDLAEFWADITFSIDEMTLYDEENYSPNLHTAQLMWYFTLRNYPEEGATDQGTYGDYMWFGLPLYDYRYNRVRAYQNIDQGVTGSTNKLIYSIDNSTILPVSDSKGLEIGREYTIHANILPMMLDAYIYGCTNGALQGSNVSRMYIGYMNFGWEVPGSFGIKSTISNFNATAIMK